MLCDIDKYACQGSSYIRRNYLERELCSITESQAVKIRKQAESSELTEEILNRNYMF